MVTLQDVTQETGISYYTLVKYTGLGLIPKPQRVWRGRKGSESLYPDSIVKTIKNIEKDKQSGLTLRQIAENRRLERTMDVFTAVMAVFPEYHFSHGDIIGKGENPDGSITVKVEMIGRKI